MPWRPLGFASFARQAWDNVHFACPGVPWAPSLRGRRGTICIAKGSDARPVVPWDPPLSRGMRGTMSSVKA